MMNAWKTHTAVPAFNVPYLPMMEPIIEALRDTKTFGLIEVARLEWVRFEAKSQKAIYDEYQKLKDERFTRLHLDHVPVIDEDHNRVDFMPIIQTALDLGYESVMVDGSRLPFEENIQASKQVADMARKYGVPVEAELGAVMGHEVGPLPPYETLFASGKGFTDPEEAAVFVKKSGVSWLSVAIGNIHGAIQGVLKDQKKVEAKLDIEHLSKINERTRIPLVLHGGTGIQPEYIRKAVGCGITKINIGAAIRQPYTKLAEKSVKEAQKAVYDEVVVHVKDILRIAGTAATVNPV